MCLCQDHEQLLIEVLAPIQSPSKSLSTTWFSRRIGRVMREQCTGCNGQKSDAMLARFVSGGYLHREESPRREPVMLRQSQRALELRQRIADEKQAALVLLQMLKTHFEEGQQFTVEGSLAVVYGMSLRDAKSWARQENHRRRLARLVEYGYLERVMNVSDEVVPGTYRIPSSAGAQE